MANYVGDVQDFVDVHYKLTNRKDSRMWEYHAIRGHNPRLTKKLEVYAKEYPAKWNRPRGMPWAFNEVSWIDMLNAYKFKFESQEIIEPIANRMQKELARIRSLKQGRADFCATPYEFIKGYYDSDNNPKLEELSDKQLDSPKMDE
jgi:hypothetical protein